MANNIIKRVWNQGSMTPIEDLQGSAFTNENGGHTFQISGVDSNGEALALSGTVAASFLRPDQTTVGISGSVSGGVASVTLSAECYGIPGRFGLVIFLTSDGKKTAIYSCVGNVARSSTDAVAPGVTADVVDLINEIETAVGTIPASYSALMADIAPTYSSSALYAVGDYAWYEGDLKRCIVPITVGETYTPAHWTSAVVGDDVCALKSAIGYIPAEVVNARVQGTGIYMRTDGSTSLLIPVSENDVIKITGCTGTSYLNMLTSYADNQSYVQYATGYSGAGTTINSGSTITATAPSNAAYAIILLNVSGTSDRTPKQILLNGECVYPLIVSRVNVLEDETEDINDELSNQGNEIDGINELITGIVPDATNTYTYNPNPSHEGEQYPAGTYGNGCCLFDVSDFVGQRVQVLGTEFGWFMQFTNTPGSSSAPGYYNGGKTNGNSATTVYATILSGTKYLAVNIIGDRTKAKLYADNRLIDKKYLDEQFGADKWYAAIGDSITAGTGASAYGKNFYWLLSEKLLADNTITKRVNVGVGGAGAAGIAANCGAYGLYISSGVTIPATATGVTVSLNVEVKNAGNNVIEANRLNDCYLSGIAGKLTYSNSNYVFTRNESGDEKHVASGSPLILYGGKIAENAEVLTIFVGTNNALDTNPSTEKNNAVIELIDTMTRLSKNGKYIVISPYVNSVNSDFRSALSQKYGQRFVDLYAYMSGQSIYDALAEELIESGSQSDWETILLSDGVHPNDTGHMLIYERIYQQMVELGWVG